MMLMVVELALFLSSTCIQEKFWTFQEFVIVHTMNETLHLCVYISMARSSFIVQEVYMETVLFVL